MLSERCCANSQYALILNTVLRLYYYSMLYYICNSKRKGKVVYGQEPPSGESTTTECGSNYQLLAVITEVAQCGAPSCSQPQPATDNGIRDGRSNWLVAPPPYTGQYPLSSTYCTLQCGMQITRLAALSQPRTCDFRMPDQRLASAATQDSIEVVIFYF